MSDSRRDYFKGLRDGLPIGLGYIPVSFSFGMMAVGMGLPWWIALIISVTNITSAGQLAGIGIIAAGGGFAEMALTQLVINIRYSLMSASLSQKLDKSMTAIHRLLASFFVTDEVFGVASSADGDLSNKYLYGLGTAPISGWILGTLLGSLAGGILPDILRSALSIALYAMFIAIILPPARRNRAVLLTVAVAVGLSCLFRYLPALSGVPSGFAVIICSIAAAVLAALLFPVKEDGREN